MTVYNIQDFDI